MRKKTVSCQTHHTTGLADDAEVLLLVDVEHEDGVVRNGRLVTVNSVADVSSNCGRPSYSLDAVTAPQNQLRVSSDAVDLGHAALERMPLYCQHKVVQM